MKNSAAGIVRSPSRSARDELGVEREQDRGEVGGRVAVRDRAADRAAVAHLWVADERGGLSDQRAVLREHRIADELRVPGERADRDPVAVLADVAQLVEPADVDEQRRAREAQAQQGNERVPARQELRVLVAAEQRDRLVDRPGPLVLEGGGDHAPALAAAWTARRCCGTRCSGRGCPRARGGSPPPTGFGFSWSSEIVAITNPGVQ